MATFNTSYLLARLAVGTSLFGHGLVRLPKLERFSQGMATQFQHSIIPGSMVVAFAYVLPFVEFGTGLLLLLGLFTRQALIAGVLLMICLIFGTTTIEQWDIISLQLFHILFLVGLLIFVEQYNGYSLDHVVRPIARQS